MFKVGDRVKRLEDRLITEATVLKIEEDPEENIYEIQYDEGGKGWWPESCLKLME